MRPASGPFATTLVLLAAVSLVAATHESTEPTDRDSSPSTSTPACSVVAPLARDTNVTTLDLRVSTADSLFGGTDRDVWLDIGPKAWRLDGSFPRNTTRTISISVNDVADGSSLTPSPVSLQVGDLRFVRVEKKGIGLIDVPDIPGQPELREIKNSGFAKKIGGITNAPDSVEELLLPGPPTPENLLADARAKVAVAELAAHEAQGALAKVEAAVREADEKLQASTTAWDNAVHRVGEAEKALAAASNNVRNLQTRLSDEAFKFVVKTVCHDERVRKLRNIACLAGQLAACFTTVTVCHNEKVITDSWHALNATLPALENELTTKAAQLDAASRNAAAAEAARTVEEAARTAAFLQLKPAQLAASGAETAARAAREGLEELQEFVKNHSPHVELPLPGQWVPSSLTLVVNGSDFVRCDINARLKRGEPSWIGTWERLSPAESFLNGLRVNLNSESSGFDRYVSGFSGYFKVQNISGWEHGPVSSAEVTGILRHAPSAGADGFVSLDLELENVKLSGRTWLLDDQHEIRHRRYIRVEYLHRGRNGSDDVRYQQWSVGTRFKIEGPVERDTDRATFYELHPTKAGQVRVVGAR
jgi:hypothetical protein